MIQKNFILTVAITLFTLVGCGQSTPDLDSLNKGKNNISDANQISNETVTINENAYGNENQSSNDKQYNSSSDGYKSIYFAFGDYSISEAMQNRVSVNVNIAKGSNTIKIEGNCDEFGTDEYNYALGLKRAKAVKDAMSIQGVDSHKIVIVSFGESNPVCTNPTDACYAKNRRVDLHLVK